MMRPVSPQVTIQKISKPPPKAPITAENTIESVIEETIIKKAENDIKRLVDVHDRLSSLAELERLKNKCKQIAEQRKSKVKLEKVLEATHKLQTKKESGIEMRVKSYSSTERKPSSSKNQHFQIYCRPIYDSFEAPRYHNIFKSTAARRKNHSLYQSEVARCGEFHPYNPHVAHQIGGDIDPVYYLNNVLENREHYRSNWMLCRPVTALLPHGAGLKSPNKLNLITVNRLIQGTYSSALDEKTKPFIPKNRTISASSVPYKKKLKPFDSTLTKEERRACILQLLLEDRKKQAKKLKQNSKRQLKKSLVTPCTRKLIGVPQAEAKREEFRKTFQRIHIKI